MGHKNKFGKLFSCTQIVTTFFFVFFLSSCAYAYDLSKPLTDTEKQNALDSFSQFEVDNGTKRVMKKTVPCEKTSSAETQCGVSVSQPLRSVSSKYWFVDGKFRVEVTYLNDKDHPIMYAGSEQYRHFKVNRSLVFKEQMSEIILRDYLGTDYQKYSPTLLAVTTTVSIKLFVTSSEELQELIDDPRITDLRHIGDHEREVIAPRG